MKQVLVVTCSATTVNPKDSAAKRETRETATRPFRQHKAPERIQSFPYGSFEPRIMTVMSWQLYNFTVTYFDLGCTTFWEYPTPIVRDIPKTYDKKIWCRSVFVKDSAFIACSNCALRNQLSSWECEVRSSHPTWFNPMKAAACSNLFQHDQTLVPKKIVKKSLLQSPRQEKTKHITAYDCSLGHDLKHLRELP